ncbi:MAG: hypothetical protein ABR569_04705, partial [Gaiellaceae bacterium]
MDARRALLGLDPPRADVPACAAAGPRSAGRGRARRRSDDGWILGLLIWPASRLGELEGDGVPVSAVLDAPLPTMTARVEWVETRWPASPALRGEVFVELPIDAELEPNLERLPASGAHAKVRCRGERTPEPGELARFVQACAAVG